MFHCTRYSKKDFNENILLTISIVPSMKAYNIPEKYMRGILGKKFAASKNKKVNKTSIPYISVMRTLDI